MFRRLLLACSLLLAPSLLTAQRGGTIVWSLTGTLPDTARKLLQGMISEIDLRFTMATDGTRTSFTIAPGAGLIASSLAMDLSTVQMQVVTSTADDTTRIGIVLPPQLATQMGGGIGVRMDIPNADSLFRNMVPDSIMAQAKAKAAENEPSFHITDTGRSDAVSGTACHVWSIASTGAVATDTVEFCLAPQTAAMKSVMDGILTSRFAAQNKQLEEMYRGKGVQGWPKDQVPIRISFGGMKMELVSVSSDTPAASAFLLPEGLTPFDTKLLEGMFGAAGGSGTPEG